MTTKPQTTRNSVLERAWRFATSPAVIGSLIALAGSIATIVAVTGHETGWLEPFRPSFALPAVAGLLSGAGVLAFGAWWERWRTSEPASGLGSRRARLIPALGGAALGMGAVLLVASWLAILRAQPAGEMILTQGETAESFSGRVAGESVDIMLPERFRLTGVEFRDPPVFDVALTKPGSEPHRRARIAPGQPVDVGNLRATPVGLAADSSSLRATVSSSEDDTITATAAEGETFRLRPEGTEYEVAKIVKNYLGSLGPAVQLESSKHGTFWAFQRMPETEQPEFLHDLRVDRLEQAPGVVFSVVPLIPRWPAGVAGVLLLVGFAMLLVSPERIRRATESPEAALASINDAGRLLADIESEEDSE